MQRAPLSAGLREDQLTSETVGTWVCEVAPGTVLTPGLRVGRLCQARRWRVVLAPDDARGRTVSSVVVGPVDVAHGSVLLALGDAPTLASDAPADEGLEAGLVPVKVGMTGALYRRPAPDQPHFAPAGTAVEPRAVVALIEVMKTYNPIKAPQAGTIVRWLVDDGATVEPGTVILLLRPV